MQTIDLAFEEFGDPGHKPLIILHGFFASSRNWRLQAQRLAGKRHVYALDLRNHGQSPHHSLMDYPSMCADVLAFMAKHGLAKVGLLGHSMGGKVAMWLALNNPHRVEKLVVADIAPVSYQHQFAGLMDALKALPLAALVNRREAETWLADAIPDVAYRQFLLQNLLLREGQYYWRIDLDIFAKAAPYIVAFPSAKHLSPFLGETLFIAGADSNYVAADDVVAFFPDAVLNFIDNAGHWLHVQQPETFFQNVTTFLDGD